MNDRKIDPKTAIEQRLDRLEKRLPALPAAGLRLQRSVAQRGCAIIDSVAKVWARSVSGIAGDIGEATKTVAGTANDAGADAVDAVKTSSRRITGQARAESSEAIDDARRHIDLASQATGEVVDRVATDVTRAADALTAIADPDRTPTGETYDELTKPELYRRAADHDIAGRSQMSKSELIDALIDAERSTEPVQA